MNFEIVEENRAKLLRERFIERFVNTENEYYKKYYLQTNEYIHSFLWDCLKDFSDEKNRCTQEQAAELLEKRGGVYFMWDFWREGTVFADEYPNAVIKANGAELGKLSVDEWNAELEAEKHDCYIEHPQLPSDIYVFDESLSWYVVFTHEFDDCEDIDDIVRFCIHWESELCADGQYRRVSNAEKAPLNSQGFFYEQAYKDAEQTAPEAPAVPEPPKTKPETPSANAQKNDAPIKVKVRELRKP